MKNLLEIFRKGKEPIRTIIWGIRVPEKVKVRWLMLAAIMGIPVNRLVTYVLQDWVQHNADILTDADARHKLAERINQLYLDNKMN